MTIAGAGGAATAIEIQAALDGVKRKCQSSTSKINSGLMLKKTVKEDP